MHTKSEEAHACVERDLDLLATRADRYREKRRTNGVIRSAQQSMRQATPSRTCLRNSPSVKKSVSFDGPTDKSESLERDMQPAHWIDGFHEPEETHPSLIVNGENESHEERVRRAVDEDSKSWSTSGTLGSSTPSERELAQELYFHTGDNTGAELLIEHMKALITRDGRTSCVDDTSGEVLDEAGVRAARALEMDFFHKMGVYDLVTREEAVRSGKGKIIKGRWLDVNKGDSVNPDYRSRFVGKEFNTGVDSTLYAATPPLEALKLLISTAASKRHGGVHMMFSDVKRAYFHAPATRELYVEVPKEDPNWQPGFLGRLKLSLYGTRDAAANWQR